MTLRDLINNGVTIQGNIKIQCCGEEYFPEVYYEGIIDLDGIAAIEKYLDRDITYIYPYIVVINKVSFGGICIEIEAD